MRPHVLCRAVGGPGTRIDESEVSSLSANSHTQRHGRRRRRDLDVDAGDAHPPATAGDDVGHGQKRGEGCRDITPERVGWGL